MQLLAEILRRRALDTIAAIVKFLRRTNSEVATDENGTDHSSHSYPSLVKLTENVTTFPEIVRAIDTILDKFGKIKDSAAPTLSAIRHDLAKTEGSISRTLFGILRAAQSEGLVEKEVTPTLRDGRLVIPVAPGLKRKIRGIVHDESASGKTVFVEPAEVVEANNRIRELESEEKREIIRILTEFTCRLRPHVNELLYSYKFDFNCYSLCLLHL